MRWKELRGLAILLFSDGMKLWLWLGGRDEVTAHGGSKRRLFSHFLRGRWRLLKASIGARAEMRILFRLPN